jgi:hypothetical protein
MEKMRRGGGGSYDAVVVVDSFLVLLSLNHLCECVFVVVVVVVNFFPRKFLCCATQFVQH